VPKAFVLINVDQDAKREIIKEIRERPETSEVYTIQSDSYDIIAKFDAKTKETLHEAVASIRTIDGVKSTLTMDVIENKQHKKSRPLQI
jgi:DNA-binding Lrp family transcriptional regulator